MGMSQSYCISSNRLRLFVRRSWRPSTCLLSMAWPLQSQNKLLMDVFSWDTKKQELIDYFIESDKLHTRWRCCPRVGSGACMYDCHEVIGLHIGTTTWLLFSKIWIS